MTLKPKILYSGKDHPSLPSGYGIISRYFLPLLGDYYGRENIIIYTPVFQRDAIGSWEGMTVVSGTEWGFGENLLQEHYETYGCNLLLQLGDTWPLGILPDLALADKVLWVQWMPVDWLGMPKNIINRIKPAHKLIPFSQYGENSLRKADLPNVGKKIWLGLNTHLWRPIPRENLPGVMESLAFSNDTFNILIVAANQERKRVRLQLEAIALLRRTNPDFHPRLYLHSQINGERDLRADMDELGILDINVFPDPYLITQGGFTEEQMVSVFNCADVVLNVCMPPEELVLVNSGVKCISEIREGEKVFTHLGRYREVAKIFCRDYSGDMITITPYYSPSFSLTPNHPVRAIKGVDCPYKGEGNTCHPGCQFESHWKVKCGCPHKSYSGQWVPTGGLRSGDYLVFPREYPVKDLDYLLWKNTSKGKQLPERIPVNKDVLRLFGFYSSEGYSNPNSKKSGVAFCFNANEISYMDEVRSSLKSYFDVDTRLDMEGNRGTVWAYSKNLVSFLSSNFGYGARNKRIPEWVMGLPKEKVMYFVSSLWDGDGSRMKRGSTIHCQYGTTSRDLAHQVWVVLLRCGIMAGLRYQKSRDAYHITYTEGSIHHGWVDEENVYLLIRRVDTKQYNGKVHNLEVDGDNSYCAPLPLHNCMEGFGYSHIQAQACGVPVVALSEGAGPELVQFGIEVPPIGAETSPHQMTQPIPNQVAIAKALEELWRKRQQTGYPLRNQRAVDFVQENFSWDKIASQWFEVIDQCMEERERYCMSIPRPSEEVEKRASEVIELS